MSAFENPVVYKNSHFFPNEGETDRVPTILLQLKVSIFRKVLSGGSRIVFGRIFGKGRRGSGEDKPETVIAGAETQGDSVGSI